jgi:hypothetical protein
MLKRIQVKCIYNVLDICHLDLDSKLLNANFLPKSVTRLRFRPLSIFEFLEQKSRFVGQRNGL